MMEERSILINHCADKNRTGYGTHGDYIFGWKGDSLQRAMDSPCYVNCPTLKTQSVSAMNKCAVKRTVDENIDGCKFAFSTLLANTKSDEMRTDESKTTQGWITSRGWSTSNNKSTRIDLKYNNNNGRSTAI